MDNKVDAGKMIRNLFIGAAVLLILVVTFNLLSYSKNNDTISGLRPAFYEDTVNKMMPGLSVAVKLPEDITFAGERVPLENFDVRESLDKELLKVSFWHSEMFLYLKRANRYFPVIEPILKKNGVPDDFKYVCVIESGLTDAVSPAGAEGFWQFMPAAAKEYGLEINSEVDERYNLKKSTEAACKYLKRKYEKFGSWTMSAASYNSGSKGIDEHIEYQQENSY
jgi:hypothetical protein